MELQKILSVLEEMAPLGYAEDFDNVGLLVGNQNMTISGVLVCHDALESVIDEAIAKKCNLVVSFHPILFSGIKKIVIADIIITIMGTEIFLFINNLEIDYKIRFCNFR